MHVGATLPASPPLPPSLHNNMKVLAMQALGSTVSYLRKKQPDGLLPFATALHLTLQMLTAIEAMHTEVRHTHTAARW